MKKLFALLCLVGVILPYYNIYKFIEANNWEWSTALFFEQINLNYAMKVLNADLTLAVLAFLVFIFYKLKINDISLKQFLKYFVSLFVVGFSLALPLYLYDNYKQG
tara:strand:- start:212 stop:529 length:318 start_codon:yes stop_codon:yes gene_type:complete